MDRWSSSLGHGSMYGFLEPQSIHNAKDRHAKCQHYIESWVKESQREVYLGAYFNQYVKFMQMLVKKIFALYVPNYCRLQGPIGSWLFCVHGMMLLSGFVHCVRSLIFISKLQLTS